MREETYLLINTIMIAVVIALLIPVIILVAHPAQQSKQQLTISSSVQREIQPDELTVTISVVTLNKDIKESLKENTNKANQIISTFKSNPDLRVETSHYNINTQREWDPDTKQYINKGYQVTNTIKVKTTKTDLAGKIISDSVALGGNRVQSVVYSLSKKATEDLRNSMLPEAVNLAKEKATTIAELMNKKIKGIYNINVQEPYFPPVYRSYDNEMLAKPMATGTPDLEPSSQKVTLGVTVYFKV